MLTEFAERVRRDAPPLAVVLDVTVEHVSEPVVGASGFRIVPSVRTRGARTLVPPDVGICADCAREMADPRTAATGIRSSTAPTAGPATR
ncbi:hypothetical protein GS425_02595 [Rhodococcus hoagii]|nr:hypothetical protein [Prescottella equi]